MCFEIIVIVRISVGIFIIYSNLAYYKSIKIGITSY